MRTVNIITSTLPRRHGGRTRTILERAKMLGEQGFKVRILTMNYQPKLSLIVLIFRLTRLINKNVSIYNIYDHYKDVKKQDGKISIMADGKTVNFKKERKFFTYWLNEVLEDGDVVINDVRTFDYPLYHVKHKIRRIYQLHNSHCAIDSKAAKTKKEFRFLLESSHDEDSCIVALTKSQRADIVSRYPHLEENVVVIPHAIQVRTIKTRVNDKQICIVARLEPQKNLLHAIEAFDIFKRDNPDCTLVICGDGKSRKELELEVEKRSLSNCVVFLGYRKRVGPVFQQSKFMIMSSHFEGFPMSILESLANGCPVVSYDIRYGPSEMIQFESGRLSNENTPTELARAMALEAKTSRDRATVSHSVEKYSPAKNRENWLNAIDGTYSSIS